MQQEYPKIENMLRSLHSETPEETGSSGDVLLIWLFRNKSTLSLCFTKTPISSCFLFHMITTSLSPSSICSKPQCQHQPSEMHPRLCLGSPRCCLQSCSMDKDRHKHVLKEEHLQLDPTKDRAILERLLSTHTSSVVTAGRGISFFCPSKLLIMCEPVSSANYRFTVTKEIALNTTLGQVRNKQIRDV